MSQTLTQTRSWQIDPLHSGIHFTVRHMVITKVRGRFTGFNGRLTTPGDDLARAGVHVEIDAASIDTGVADRDAHLRSPDFLDVERFPHLVFDSQRIEPDDESGFRLVGNLDLHGVVREAVLEVEGGERVQDPWGGERMGFTARTSLDRRDFGLEWNQLLETGGVLVGNRIDIELEIQAVAE